MTATTPTADPPPRPRPLPAWLGVLVGIAAAGVGLLPWLVTGLRLPLQNLWAVETRPEDMPRVLLPFNQYLLVLLIGVLVTGSVLAGLAARVLRERLPRGGVLAVAAGLLLVQLVAVVQTTAVVHAGLTERLAATLYLLALVGVAGLSVLVGAVALALVATAPPGGAVVGLCVGALALGPWLSGLVVPSGSGYPSPGVLALLTALRWVPPVLVGLAVAWAGLRTPGRVAAAVVGLLLVWVVPALTTGLVNAGGSRALARDPAELVAYAAEVFRAALTTPALALPPIAVAVLVAVVGLVVGPVLRRRGGGDGA
ncbi:hypothetical protein ACFFOM_02585 [Microlunatus capsulatus]|uniref:Uncharacterized protein n=1 Tax=Microlunatus capsulatus TaxID=99117 RepID=A0ABS4Z2X2_9ACTN|nr:hypothetical protein [Microlunatus capsulatus]MBP2415388.1 hypothetical protein [Microlunatus capsulatus]